VYPDPDGLDFVGAFMAGATPEDVVWLVMAPDPPEFSLSIGPILKDTDGDTWFDALEEILMQDMDGGMDTDDDGSGGVDVNLNTSCPYSAERSTGIPMFSYLFAHAYLTLMLSSLISGIAWSLYLSASYVQSFRAFHSCWYIILI